LVVKIYAVSAKLYEEILDEVVVEVI